MGEGSSFFLSFDFHWFSLISFDSQQLSRLPLIVLHKHKGISKNSIIRDFVAAMKIIRVNQIGRVVVCFEKDWKWRGMAWVLNEMKLLPLQEWVSFLVVLLVSTRYYRFNLWSCQGTFVFFECCYFLATVYHKTHSFGAGAPPQALAQQSAV